MYKKLLIILFALIYFTSAHTEDFKIVYLNVDRIMQESIAGKSIKKNLKIFIKKI